MEQITVNNQGKIYLNYHYYYFFEYADKRFRRAKEFVETKLREYTN